MNITELKPALVWKFFHAINQVPRPSKKEGKMREYLKSFAEEYHLPFKTDACGNVLISKPATKGMEDRVGVILQGHMDMVCEKSNDVKHDFDKDPIQTVVDGEWVRAKGTTLGADDGMAVASGLAILASEDIPHGPLECLFTVDEEQGLTGAKNIEGGFMYGHILLNLDSEDEGQIFMGCAGGKDTIAFFHYTPAPAPSDLLYFRIDVKGLLGGHSGGEIHLERGNSIKILARFLNKLGEQHPYTLCEIDGGNLHNVIPFESHAVIGIDSDDKEKAISLLNIFAKDVENELKHQDPKVSITMKSTDKPAFMIDKKTTENLVSSLVACSHGVIGSSHEMAHLVETSTNLSSLKMRDGNKIEVATMQRSSVESQREYISENVAATFRLAGAEVIQSDGYPGWEPNMSSKILKTAIETYHKLFDKDPQVLAIHAGLECGLFLEKYPYLDMISIGPTMRNVHTPNECIEIKSVDLFWKYLVALLKNIPVK